MGQDALRRGLTLVAAVLACATGSWADVTTVRDVARIEGHGESDLRGLGLVVGLAGTGDSTSSPPRPPGGP